MSTTEAKETTRTEENRRSPDRREIEIAISQQISRISYPRLRMMNVLSQSDAARIYVPRSSHGMTLFQRIEALDSVFASCERKVMKQSHSLDAFDRKTGLDRSMFDLNHFLVDMAAQMAIDQGVEDNVRDSVLEDRIKAIRAEKEATEAKSREESGKSESSRNSRKSATPTENNEPPANDSEQVGSEAHSV